MFFVLHIMSNAFLFISYVRWFPYSEDNVERFNIAAVIGVRSINLSHVDFLISRLDLKRPTAWRWRRAVGRNRLEIGAADALHFAHHLIVVDEWRLDTARGGQGRRWLLLYPRLGENRQRLVGQSSSSLPMMLLAIR